MITRRAFSTVTYNTQDFLKANLNELVKEGKLAWWAYFYHVPDIDNRKAHIHLHMIPECSVDTVMLAKQFEELDPTNPLPLRWRPCEHSKWDDWYLYCCHDKYYLRFKGLERNTYYSYDDCVSSDPDYLYQKVHSIDQSPYSGYHYLMEAFDQGLQFDDLVRAGKVPLHRVVQYATVWKALQRKPINPILDTDTGEIIN